MDQQNEDPIAQARRYLTDIVVFEGAKFVVPKEGGAVEATTAPVAEAPQSAEAAAAAGGQGPVDLEEFRQKICDCTRCGLGSTRNKFVFGAGNPSAGIVFVGEAPGAEEDRRGEPFVGAAGQLLTKIIAAMGLGRADVYICNILKCRPPNKVICTLGRFAAQTLLRSSESMGRLRGQAHQYEGIPLVATYHPAALLRNPQWKRPTWEDVKKVRALYDDVVL